MRLERVESEGGREPLTVYRGGSGPPLHLLHDEWGIAGLEPLLEALADDFAVSSPVHPGFEDSPVSPRLRGAGDLALLHLGLLEREAEPAVVVGLSFGGWVALEMAVRCRHHIAALVLVGPTGLRFGAPDERNFVDLFAHDDEALAALLYSDPEKARRPEALDDEALVRWVRNREAVARYGWEPYLHTPGLEDWTGELGLPTLLLHGAQDRFVAPGYYEKVAGAVGGARRREVPGCGHYPHVERPEEVAAMIGEFLSGRGAP
ncbi:MAG TPA: alpha/beta hydrolase [Acidimicrobiales bacterium]|nr:alpha/beta hydrolase [Acidimicrobiales bacterium]